MPVRDKFPKGYFEGNPFAGHNAKRMYEKLQWGNKPNRTTAFRAPESMAAIGRLAKIYMVGGGVQTFEDGEYYVGVGVKSNWVYFVPMDGAAKPMAFPKDFWAGCVNVGKVRRTDYYSEKGGEDGYYFHDHEKPFPVLCGLMGHYALRPAKTSGGRSYAVGPEGIIG